MYSLDGKHMEQMELEKQQQRRKEQASKEIIAEISRKLRQTEKKASEEGKVTLEYKRKYDALRKKLDKATKDKNDNVTQLKSLLVLFT